jgi:hypothetical protein
MWSFYRRKVDARPTETLSSKTIYTPQQPKDAIAYTFKSIIINYLNAENLYDFKT